MNISGVSNNDPISLSKTNSGEALGKDTFMRLLVQQMRNQDPLEPTKNEQMLAQLAQFQNLEEMDKLNNNIVGLAVLQQSNALLQQLTSASGLIGQEVGYRDGADGSTQWGRVDSIKVEDGIATLSIGGKNIPLADVLQVGAPPTPDSNSSSDSASDNA